MSVAGGFEALDWRALAVSLLGEPETDRGGEARPARGRSGRPGTVRERRETEPHEAAPCP